MLIACGRGGVEVPDDARHGGAPPPTPHDPPLLPTSPCPHPPSYHSLAGARHGGVLPRAPRAAALQRPRAAPPHLPGATLPRFLSPSRPFSDLPDPSLALPCRLSPPHLPARRRGRASLLGGAAERGARPAALAERHQEEVEGRAARRAAQARRRGPPASADRTGPTDPIPRRRM